MKEEIIFKITKSIIDNIIDSFKKEFKEETNEEKLNNVLCIIINTLCSFVSLTMPEDGVPEFLDNIKKKLKEYYDLKIKDNK